MAPHTQPRPRPQDQVRFHGFDAPVEYSGAPSPRRALSAATDYLPAALRPESARDLDALLGDDADWTNQTAMLDPATSIGDSDRARALRIVADDLASTLHRAAPALHPADPTGHVHAAAHAHTAQGLLRYHAAMANPAPDRIATLLSLRAEMMAENLLAILAQEQRRGPSLVFAHNVHLQRAQSHMPVGVVVPEDEVSWSSAGALVGLTLGERYAFLATDANPHSDPGTLQGMLAEATTRRALFPAPALRAALPPSTGTGQPIVPGHLPLNRQTWTAPTGSSSSPTPTENGISTGSRSRYGSNGQRGSLRQPIVRGNTLICRKQGWSAAEATRVSLPTNVAAGERLELVPAATELDVVASPA
jgi:hypothetical protein